MTPERIFTKAEAWKRKTHRLSLDLRLKSVSDAASFLREHGVVLWNAKAELPNLLDAIIGRVANGQERVYGKPAENCYRWREQLMSNPDFLECRFFSKLSTVLHQDLWPFATVFARENRKKVEAEQGVSKEVRKILTFLEREGPTRTDNLRKALRFSTPEQGRIFHRAKRDLQNQLVLLAKEDPESKTHTHAEILDFWENCMPKSVRGKADQIDQNGGRLKLLSATLQSCVLSNEKRIPAWFTWCDEGVKESLEKLLQKKDFVRVPLKKENWIIPRKAFESR
jgi:hypothetical protein